MGSSVGTILGGAAGFMLGGPAGAALGAGLGSGVDTRNAASQASAQQASAAGQANQALTGMYQQNQANLSPWLGLGTQAGNQLGYMLGLQGYNNPMSANAQMGSYGGLTTPFSLSQFNQDPGYAFRLQQGQQALERSAAARGMTLSGAQQKALTSYGQGMGSQEYQNAFNRDLTQKQNLYNMLSGTSQQGMAAGSALAGVGQNTANQISGNLMNLGAGQSAATLAGQNAMQGGVNQAMNFMNYGGGSTGWNSAGSPWTSMSNWYNNMWGTPTAPASTANYMNLGSGLSSGAGGFTGTVPGLG